MKNGFYDLDATTELGNEQYRIIVGNDSYTKSDVVNYNSKTISSKWQLNNLPGLTNENYISSLKNNISKIEFQLRTINMPNQPAQNRLASWPELTKQLLDDEGFGANLSTKNNWMEDETDKLLVKGNELKTAQNIYNYVQQNFICVNDEAIYLSDDLKKIFQTKKGNVADVNLLLTAMLKQAKLNAEPVLVSTRDNGVPYEVYPLINKFNYVITSVVINNNQILLDASDKLMGFNHLPQKCYNVSGRIINKNAFLVSLAADSVKEVKNTNIDIDYDKDTKKLKTNFTSTLGYYESYNLRNEINKTTVADFFKKIKSNFNYEVQFGNTSIDSLKNYESPIKINYDYSFNFDEDVIYFNPLMGEGYKTNPYTALKRLNPIELPYTTNEEINFKMEIPKGYKVDELPKSARVKFNEDEALFEYIIQATEETILLRCKIVINVASFVAEDYEFLREFYNNIIKKQSEQIVFKKIK